MTQLQKQIEQLPNKDKIALVSFSVDPDFDTPKVLTEYAGRFQADPAIWTFLTGSRDAMWQVVGQGFHLALQNQPENKTSPILHSTRLILIGPDSHIRGYYEALEADSRAKLMKDAALVLDDSATPAEARQ
jgi:protein SCO1/2